MKEGSITGRLGERGADVDGIVDEVIEHPERIAELAAALKVEKGTAKYAYEKVLRLVSERRPERIYPWFDLFAEMLDSDNSFLKWGAILTVANLAAVDTEDKFEAIFERYYAPIAGPVMVTAANIIGGSARIARARPMLTERITREILKVEKAKYESRGVVSPECRNVALGHAIDTLDELFDQIDDKAAVVRLVKRQLGNTRRQVVKKAERFLQRHAASQTRKAQGSLNGRKAKAAGRPRSRQ